MTIGIDVNGMLERLKSQDPHVRDRAAAELGDLLEADYLKGQKYSRVVRQLIQAAISETDRRRRKASISLSPRQVPRRKRKK